MSSVPDLGGQHSAATAHGDGGFRSRVAMEQALARGIDLIGKEGRVNAGLSTFAALRRIESLKKKLLAEKESTGE